MWACYKTGMCHSWKNLGVKDIWFQQDRAPTHYADADREHLTEVFPGRWIGRGSPVLPAPTGQFDAQDCQHMIIPFGAS